MADRLLPVSTTPGAITGNNYMDAVQDELTGVTDRTIYQLTAVSGTNTITASVEIPLTAGLVDGMRFILVPAVTNTSSSVTLNVQITGAKALVDNLGAVPRVGGLQAGGKYLIEYDLPTDKYWILTYIPTSTFNDRPSFRNVIGDNGGFEIWQRGTSIAVAASTTAYTADRWYVTTNANQATTVFQSTFGDNRSRFCGIVQRNNGQTGIGTYVFAFPLTTEEVIRLRGSKASLRFRTTPGANFSPASGALSYAFYVGTAAEGKRGAGFTGETTVIGVSTINIAGDTSIAVTSAATVPTNATQGELRFTWTPVGTAGAQDWVVFDDVQIEAATASTEFEYAPFHFMLRGCQRHYAKTFNYDTAPATSAGLANAISGGPDLAAIITDLNTAQGTNPSAALGTGNHTSAGYGCNIHWRFPVQMRTTPTIVTFNPSAANANIRLPTGNGGVAIDSTITVSPETSTGDMGVTFVGAGVTAAIQNSTRRLIGYVHATADASL